MTDQEIAALLDRAAGGDEPGDEDLARRATERGRQIIGRRRALGVAALVVAVAVGVVAWPTPQRVAPTPPSLADEERVEAPYQVVDNEVSRRFVGERGGAGSVLVAASSDPVDVVVTRRQANPEEAAGGGKAAQLWVSRDGGAFKETSDYLSYDLACMADDEVCPEVTPDRGFASVLELGNDRVLALVALPAGFQLLGFTENPNLHPAGEGTLIPATGPLTWLITAAPWTLTPAVRSPDGRTFYLPLPPGGVVPG